MALYTDAKSLVQDNLPDNISQLIDPVEHRAVENKIIDDVGQAQVYVNPAVTDNPGTPQNPRAYFGLPGTYTNFGNLPITAPLGVLQWNGTAWSATQLPIPSGYNYFRAKTTAALMTGTPYTSISIDQSGGGWNALPGQWVQIVNRRTGEFEFFQLAVEMEDDDTSITVKSYTIHANYPVGSIIELYPTINMREWVHIPVVGGGVDYIDVPAEWRPPPIETVDHIVYYELLSITKNGFECRYAPTITTEFHFKQNDSNRHRFHFLNVLEAGEDIRIRYKQPTILYPIS